ncbi:MAG: bifunctional DNA-formamidopyrimidine glycosylase/DNA-(apurinic or apyrimidinic site) lyase [Pontibacterium sp.]
MPELPEVETTRRGVAPYIEGQTIKTVIVRQPALRWQVPESIDAQTRGKEITSVSRRGKYLLLSVSGGKIMIHLGMSGSLRIIEACEPPAFHDHVDIVLSNGKAVRFTDPRRFGSVLWQDEGEVHALLASLGPEPLTDEFDGQYLAEKAAGKRVPIKSLLMDSKVVVGVGNIYANEALFSAGIHPKRQAGRISKLRLEKLVLEVKRILAHAIDQGGTTLKDFVGGDGKPGYFKQSLNVYGRGSEACVTCGATLVEIRMSQRTTVFCKSCQR